MTVYDLKDVNGRVFAFEVNNLLLSRHGVGKVVRTIPGARITRAPRRPFSFASEDDHFCEFEVEGKRFTAWEPFGDNSRFWIGPEPPEWCEQVATVREAFLRYQLLKHPWAWLILLFMIAAALAVSVSIWRATVR